MSQKIETIDEYIEQYSGQTKERLILIRKTILKVEPNLVEKISWGMPTFWLNKNIIHFAVSKNHIGIYPSPEAIEKFEDKLSKYVYSKGAVQLPHDQSIPYELIAEFVKYNLKTV